MDNNTVNNVDNLEVKPHSCADSQNFWLWLGALVIGGVLGMLGIEWINTAANFIATVFTRLFQFIAVPTIALAVTITLATFGTRKDTGRIFRRTITYTLLTTIAASAVGMLLYRIISPGNLPTELVHSSKAADAIPHEVQGAASYYEYVLGIVPDNIMRPFFEGNVLSVLLIAVAVGIALAKMPDTDNKRTLLSGLSGLQDLVSKLIHWLIHALPLGILAFAAQLSAEVSTGVVVSSIGKYVAVILGGNVLQFFVVLPLFLVARGLNPIKVMRAMTPAVLMALFTKSSAATLPVTIHILLYAHSISTTSTQKSSLLLLPMLSSSTAFPTTATATLTLNSRQQARTLYTFRPQFPSTASRTTLHSSQLTHALPTRVMNSSPLSTAASAIFPQRLQTSPKRSPFTLK